jgi:hypothetical protein
MAFLAHTHGIPSWHIRMAQTCTKNDKGQADHCLTVIKVDNERDFLAHTHGTYAWHPFLAHTHGIPGTYAWHRPAQKTTRDKPTIV